MKNLDSIISAFVRQNKLVAGVIFGIFGFLIVGWVASPALPTDDVVGQIVLRGLQVCISALLFLCPWSSESL